MPRHFWRTVVVFRRYRPPLSVKKEGSSSRELGSPSESVVPASARNNPGAFRGVSNLFATSAQRVHYRWASQAHLRSVLSVSHAPDGLLLTGPCRLVSSCCHVQVSRSRGFLPQPVRDHLVGGPCLRAVGAVLLLPVARPRRSPSRRPQGLLQAGIRNADRGVTPVRRPFPLMRFCSFGLSSPVLSARLTPSPLAVLAARCSQCPGQRTHSVSIDWRPRSSIPR
jgi:hypothetical protein